MSLPSLLSASRTVVWLFWIVTMALALLYNVSKTTTMSFVCDHYAEQPLSTTTTTAIDDAPPVILNDSTNSSFVVVERKKETPPTTVTSTSSSSAVVYDPSLPQTTYRLFESPFPCFKEERNWKTIATQKSPAQEGILYTREMKTGSSTLTGVLLGLATRNGQKLLSSSSPSPPVINNKTGQPERVLCKHRVDHIKASKMGYDRRNKTRSFHISMLRHPTKRTVSHFFHFVVSFQKRVPSDANFLQWLDNAYEPFSNYYVRDLSLRNLTADMLYHVMDHEDFRNKLIQEILDEYDFIAITERLDESLVVLRHLLQLESLEEVLYVSAKTSGSFNKGPTETSCEYLIPSFVSPGMKEYFDSDGWTQEYMGVDLVLYDAAIQSLDNTIQALGQEAIQAEVAEFRRMLKVAQTKCADQTHYRCDKAGNFRGGNNTCLLWGVGCSYDCLESLRGSDWDALYQEMMEQGE